jgi:uncharacterized protein
MDFSTTIIYLASQESLMSKAMPQEIEVWYLLPALRSELAKILVSEHKLSQKDTANILGITESAISQYLKSKRGKEITFDPKELQKIRETANLIINDHHNLTKYLYNLSVFFRGSETICKLHKKHDDTLSEECKICMED